MAILAPLAALVALAAAPAEADTDDVLAKGLAVTQLSKGAIKQASLDMAYSRLTAKCATAANGTVRGATTIAGGVLRNAAAGRTHKIPDNPPVGYKVPGTRPDVIVTLNKQVRDPLGGMTVSAVSVDSAPGAATSAAAAPGTAASVVRPRQYAVARCGPVRRVPSIGAPVVASTGSDVLGGITNQAHLPSEPSGMFGGLPGLSRTLPLESVS
jgi:hypothetical protein